MKRFLCWLGWHSWAYDILYDDGFTVRAKCQWCGYLGFLEGRKLT